MLPLCLRSSPNELESLPCCLFCVTDWIGARKGVRVVYVCLEMKWLLTVNFCLGHRFLATKFRSRSKSRSWSSTSRRRPSDPFASQRRSETSRSPKKGEELLPGFRTLRISFFFIYRKKRRKFKDCCNINPIFRKLKRNKPYSNDNISLSQEETAMEKVDSLLFPFCNQ